MLIQGTDKIRGCMVLSKPKLELKKNEQRRIADEDANQPELQTAIACGFVKVLEGSAGKMKHPSSPQKQEEEKIRCRNVFTKPLGLNLMSVVNGKLVDPFPQGIQPNEDFFLTAEQLNNADVKAAMQEGYIKVVKDIKKESTLNLKELASKAQEQANTRNVTLETNEEISMPTETVEQPKNKNIKEAVIFTHTEPPAAARITHQEQEAPRRNLKLDVIDTPNPEPVEADDVPGRRAVVWNPGNNPMPFNKKVANNISFVDEEQETERRNSHPILKDKPVQPESELRFVDQEQEEQRIQAHPVLKNKPSDACDIDLV